MHLVLEETIAASVTIVFSVFTDLSHAAENITSITKLEVLDKGPVGKGTRFRETRVVFKNKEATQEMEITAFDAPRSYTVEGTSCGVQYVTVYEFNGGQRETKVTMTTSSRPVSLIGRITGPLMGWMVKGTLEKAMAADHADLKGYCEARHAALSEGTSAESSAPQ